MRCLSAVAELLVSKVSKRNRIGIFWQIGRCHQSSDDDVILWLS